MSKAKRGEAKASENSTPLPIHPALLAAHPSIPEALARWQSAKRVPPVLLLTGPGGCGKRAIGYYIAQALQCERSGFFEGGAGASDEEEGGGLFGGALDIVAPVESTHGLPCGECAACRRALSGQALDFTEIRIEDDERTLGVERFREIIAQRGFGSFSGGAKVYLVTDAERMTASAANSVLKLLEEPPPGWVFLLTVADPSLLPSTVVSRCQMLRLRPLPDATVATLLADEDFPADRIASVAKLAEGSLSRARELADDAAWETRAEILRFLAQPASAFHALIDYAAADPAYFRLLLDQFEQILADLIRAAELPGGTYRNLDARKILEDHAKKCAARKGSPRAALAFWVDRSERLFRMRREMTAPLNVKVLAQDFLAPWMDAV